MASSHLVFPALDGLYQALAPWSVALLRMITGLILVPHGLRAGFGFFPNTNMPIRSLKMLGDAVAAAGYRPGLLWAAVVIATELIGGIQCSRSGLFTRPVCVPIVVLLVLLGRRAVGATAGSGTRSGSSTRCCGRRARSTSWSMAGGALSLDRLVGWEF